MATQPYDDSEYPYSAKAPVVLGPGNYLPAGDRPFLDASAPAFSWGVLFGVVWRLSLVAGVLFVLLLMPIVVVVYRARSQAAVIADLEARGCDIDYEVSYVGEPDNLQEFLQKQFGNEYFGDVDAVWARRLTTPELAAAVCRRCARFSKLRWFEIHSDAFEFKQIASWPQLNEITSLEIHSNQITDDDLAQIAQMKQLTDLTLSSNRITEAGIRQLGGAPELSSLTLHSAPLPSGDSRNAVGFSGLTRLSLHHCTELRDRTIVNLGPLPQLTSIEFDGTAVGDEGLDHVTQGGALEWASLPGSKITDSGVGYLARCTKLTNLNLSNTLVTDDGMRKLQACGVLTHLDASDTKITGKGWNVLRGDGLMLVLDRTALDDEGLKNVLAISGLQDVYAMETKVTGTGASRLSDVEISSLTLSGNPLTSEGIQGLAKAKVGSLVLISTPVDDKSLLFFVANDSIGTLDVSGTKVTSAGAVAFYEARKQRLEKMGQEETLTLYCDFPNAVEPYWPHGGMPGSAPPDSPPIDFEQPPAGPPPSEPVPGGERSSPAVQTPPEPVQP